jgi:uncharacterized glyoxalase superfamily protein PhnB
MSVRSIVVSRALYINFEEGGCLTYIGREGGAKVAVPLADRPYGMRDFWIVDPSGNELSFGEAAGS